MANYQMHHWVLTGIVIFIFSGGSNGCEEIISEMSCHISETYTINPDGTGKVEIVVDDLIIPPEWIGHREGDVDDWNAALVNYLRDNIFPFFTGSGIDVWINLEADFDKKTTIKGTAFFHDIHQILRLRGRERRFGMKYYLSFPPRAKVDDDQIQISWGRFDCEPDLINAMNILSDKEIENFISLNKPKALEELNSNLQMIGGLRRAITLILPGNLVAQQGFQQVVNGIDDQVVLTCTIDAGDIIRHIYHKLTDVAWWRATIESGNHIVSPFLMNPSSMMTVPYATVEGGEPLFNYREEVTAALAEPKSELHNILFGQKIVKQALK